MYRTWLKILFLLLSLPIQASAFFALDSVATDTTATDTIATDTIATDTIVPVPVKYLVQFLNYDGSVLQSANLPYGTIPTYTGMTPTRPASGGYSYAFAGWNPSVDVVVGDVNYIAFYTTICAVSIGADAHGQVLVDETGPAMTYTWEEGSTHTLSAFRTDSCYEFDRWSDGSTEATRSYVVTQPTTLTAQFRLRTVPMTIGLNPKDSLHGVLTIRTDNDQFDLEGVDTTLYLPCGTTVEVLVTAAEDYHFVRWSDGSRSSVRRVTVEDGGEVRAEFAPNCYEYAEWPIVALYDWIIMLNVVEVNALGYYPKEDHVVWYRVVDEPDDMQAAKFPHDDRLVGTGYYLTIDRNMRNTADYYCVVDVSSAVDALCDTKMRSIIITYSKKSAQAPALTLSSTLSAGTDATVVGGINPYERTALRVYDAAGRLVWSQVVEGQDEYTLPQLPVAGCYTLRVSADSQSQVFRFIVGR